MIDIEAELRPFRILRTEFHAVRPGDAVVVDVARVLGTFERLLAAAGRRTAAAAADALDT